MINKTELFAQNYQFSTMCFFLNEPYDLVKSMSLHRTGLAQTQKTKRSVSTEPSVLTSFRRIERPHAARDKSNSKKSTSVVKYTLAMNVVSGGAISSSNSHQSRVQARSATAPIATLMNPRPVPAGLASEVEFDDSELELALSAAEEEEAADADEELLLPVALAEELWAVDETALDAVAEA